MQPTRREALKYLITGITAGGIILASPKIILSDDNKPKWFHDFNDPDRRPTNLEAHLAEVPRGMTQEQIDNLEEYTANTNNAGLDGIVKIKVDEALKPKKRVKYKDLLISVNGSDDLVPFATTGMGIVTPKLTNVKYPGSSHKSVHEIGLR